MSIFPLWDPILLRSVNTWRLLNNPLFLAIRNQLLFSLLNNPLFLAIRNQLMFPLDFFIIRTKNLDSPPTLIADHFMKKKGKIWLTLDLFLSKYTHVTIINKCDKSASTRSIRDSRFSLNTSMNKVKRNHRFFICWLECGMIMFSHFANFTMKGYFIEIKGSKYLLHNSEWRVP